MEVTDDHYHQGLEEEPICVHSWAAWATLLGRRWWDRHAVYQFDLFVRLAYLEYLAKARLGPLRRREPPAAAEAEPEEGGDRAGSPGRAVNKGFRSR